MKHPGVQSSVSVAQFHFTHSVPPGVALVMLMHRRSQGKLLERKIQSIILDGSFKDKNMGEIVSKMTRLEVLRQLNEPVKVHLVPDIEKGEVLVDSRGRGSLPQWFPSQNSLEKN